MLSRVADSLYWLSRYLERAEHTARILGVHWNLMLEQPPEASVDRWNRVRRSLNIDVPADQDDESTHDLLKELCFEHEGRSSIISCITAARDNARQVREQISSEMWEQLNKVFHDVRRAEQEEWWQGEPVEFLNSVNVGANLFHGLTDSTMSHGDGWQFIRLGRFFERTTNLISLIDHHFRAYGGERQMRPDAGPDAADYLEWTGLLRCATAFEAYCKVYSAEVSPNYVAEFLVLDGEFPHSIRFAVAALKDAILAIAQASPSQRGDQVQRFAGRLAATVGYADIDELISAGLHTWFDDVRKQCAQVHKGAHEAFIAYPIETALEV